MRKLLTIGSLMLLLGSCSQKQLEPLKPDIVEGEELYCLADSKEEALQIAESYEIELVNFSDGVATFHTEDDPQEVIDRGIKNGLKQLSLNILNKVKR